MFKLLYQKVSTAIISTILLSLALSLYFGYTPKEDEITDTAHYTYETLFIIYAIYVFVIYMVFGVTISWIIDVKMKKQLNQLVLYIASGALIGGGFYFSASVVTYMIEFLTFVSIGIFGALLFLVVQKIMNLTLSNVF